MISQTAEYALRAIVYLADHAEPQTNSQIAKATQAPLGYLAKILQGLSRAGLVNAQRGKHGGFTLAIAPKDLTVLQVVNAVDPIRRYPECPLGLHGITLCPLHRRLDDAAQSIEDSFGSTTIANLLEAPRDRKPLCRFPVAPRAARSQGK